MATFSPEGPLVCPRCRRRAGLGRRCPRDGAFYVSLDALDLAGRDAYLGGLIAGRYSVLRRVGVGGMGAVYQGCDEETGRVVALKFLRDEYAQHSAIRLRFVREAEAGASVDSPYVVRLLDFGLEADRTLYIIMEYVEAGTLRDEVNSHGPFSVRDIRRLSIQLLQGLAAAHDAGLVHRDLKHDNVLFFGTREDFTARILDFGVVKINAADAQAAGRVLTASGAMVGSPSYMSPEQIRGLDVGPPADLYSLAVVLYEAMTARRLFPVDNYQQLLRENARRDAPPLTHTGRGELVPPDLDRILQRALAHDPDDRFPDARTMLRAMEQMDLRTRSRGPSDLLSDAPGTLARAPVSLSDPAPETPDAPGLVDAPDPASAAQGRVDNRPPAFTPTPTPAPPAPGQWATWAPVATFAACAVVAYSLARLLL